MSESSISKISRIISDENTSSKMTLDDINFAISQIVHILEDEKIREIQIENELELIKNEEFSESIINNVTRASFLIEHLRSINKNVESLEYFLEILTKKRILLELKKEKTAKLIFEKINLDDTFLYK